MPPTALLNPINIVATILLVNVWTFLLFGLDKMKAEDGAWRISEGSLLFWALVGGTPGAYVGRAVFRHKTRKQPFSGQLHGIVALQLLAGAAGAGWMLA